MIGSPSLFVLRKNFGMYFSPVSSVNVHEQVADAELLSKRAEGIIGTVHLQVVRQVVSIEIDSERKRSKNRQESSHDGQSNHGFRKFTARILHLRDVRRNQLAAVDGINQHSDR